MLMLHVDASAEADCPHMHYQLPVANAKCFVKVLPLIVPVRSTV